MNKSAVFLFAPNFLNFGIDLALELQKKLPSDIKINGLCTGGREAQTEVSTGLGELLGDFHFLPNLENNWINQPVTIDDFINFDKLYPVGLFGDTLVADRRVGLEYVKNGKMRPDIVADRMKKSITHSDTNQSRYVIGLYKFLEEFLRKNKPEFIFCYAVAGAPALALSYVARRHGVTFIQPVSTRIEDLYILDTEIDGSLRFVQDRILCGKRVENNSVKWAQEWLENYRKQPEPPEYMKSYLKKSTSIERIKIITAGLVKAVLVAAKAIIKNTPERWEAVRRHLHSASVNASSLIRGLRHGGLALDQIEAPFIYFPLHVDPEASTMVLSPWITDQLSAIEALSKSAPPGFTVAVKEHVPMLGKRPAGFYEKIRRYSNVVLLDPRTPGLKVVKRASLTAVITGTAGWESLLFGVPVIVMGRAHYSSIGGNVICETDFSRLAKSIKSALEAKPVNDDALISYIATIYEESFQMPSEALWGDYRKLSKSEKSEICSTLAYKILGLA